MLKHGAVPWVELRSGRHRFTCSQVSQDLIAGRALWFQVEPGGRQELLSASADGSLALWDLRRLGPKAKALATAGHSYTCQSAYFAPDGALIHQLIGGGLPSLPSCSRTSCPLKRLMCAFSFLASRQPCCRDVSRSRLCMRHAVGLRLYPCAPCRLAACGLHIARRHAEDLGRRQGPAAASVHPPLQQHGCASRQLPRRLPASLAPETLARKRVLGCAGLSRMWRAGRWVSPFRAVWTPASDGVIVGNMKRTVGPKSTPVIMRRNILLSHAVKACLLT